MRRSDARSSSSSRVSSSASAPHRKHYQQALVGLPGVRFVVEPEHARSNYWLNTLLLDREFADQRDALLDALNEAGLMARPAWADAPFADV